MIKKSNGKTHTEKILARLCDNTFLKTWSFANPYNDKTKGKEFSDLIAVFENHLFIFFDREKILNTDFDANPEIYWDRWYKDVILKQTKTCHGAERYIKTNGKLYIDSECKKTFPIKFDNKKIEIHKIIIANGAQEACKHFSKENVNGSLGIIYKDMDNNNSDTQQPFTVAIDKKNPIHIFDSYNFPILLKELDTFYDFVSYIVEKENIIRKYSILVYAGEEDLLAYYLCNFDLKTKSHFIAPKNEDISGLYIEEGEWNAFIETPAYKSRSLANEKSYFWDTLIQHTLDNTLKGITTGNSDVFNGKSALYEMAKEPRISRRLLSDIMLQNISNFPQDSNPFIRKMTFMESYYKGVAYIFLQFKCTVMDNESSEYKRIRQYMLSIACGAAKNKFPYLEKVIGIAMEPPIIFASRSEDYLLLDCSNWSTEESLFYKKENSFPEMQFFLKDNLTYNLKHETEFPDNRIRS